MTDLNVTAELEVDDSGTSRQFSVNDLKPAQTGAASDATLSAGVGAAGTSPPALATSASGIVGWLRKIVDTLTGTLTVSGPATDAQLRATPLPVTGTVTATVDETTLAKDATLTSGGQKTQVTNFPATQPVSGTVAVSNPTTNPETGLAKDATLSTLVGGPGSGVATITGAGSGIQGLLRMIWDTLRGSIAVTGTFWQATQPVSIATNTPDVTDRAGRLLGHVTVDSAPTTAVTAAALPLPSGAAQDGTDITSPTAMPAGGVGIRGWLSAIWTKLNGTLAVSGTFWQATQPVSVASTVVVDTAGGRTIKFASISAASSGNNTLIAAVAGKKITVLSYSLIADAAVTAAFQDGASGTALSGAMSMAANGGVSAAGGGLPILQGSTNTLLNLNLGGAVGVRGHIAYYEA